MSRSFRRTARRSAAAVGLAVAASLAFSACSAPDSSGSASGGSLVIDASFDLKTADPNREYETTGSIVAKALYETLLTFDGDDVTAPVDGARESTR